MAKIVYSDYKEDLKSPQKVSVNDESPDIEIDTRTKRFPRVRRKSTPYGQPNHFYSVHDYFNSINDSSPYRHVRQDEPNRSNDMIFCEDTIRNPNYDNVTFGEPIDDGGNFTSWKMGWFRDIVSNYDFRDAGADRYYGCILHSSKYPSRWLPACRSYKPASGGLKLFSVWCFSLEFYETSEAYFRTRYSHW